MPADAKQPTYSRTYAEDRAEIEDLMARYLFAIDYFDWDAYVATFAPDGELEFASGTSKGHDAIRTAVTNFSKGIGKPAAAEIGDGDAHAGPCKMPCGRKADAGGAAGDDGNIGFPENVLNIRHGTGLSSSVVRTLRNMVVSAVKSNRPSHTLASSANLAKSAATPGFAGLPPALIQRTSTSWHHTKT